MGLSFLLHSSQPPMVHEQSSPSFLLPHSLGLLLLLIPSTSFGSNTSMIQKYQLIKVSGTCQTEQRIAASQEVSVRSKWTVFRLASINQMCLVRKLLKWQISFFFFNFTLFSNCWLNKLFPEDGVHIGTLSLSESPFPLSLIETTQMAEVGLHLKDTQWPVIIQQVLTSFH